jgi:hypothetical protein
MSALADTTRCQAHRADSAGLYWCTLDELHAPKNHQFELIKGSGTWSRERVNEHIGLTDDEIANLKLGL